jgi:hypothetical protein
MSLVQYDRLAVAMADGSLDIRNASTLASIVVVPPKPAPQPSSAARYRNSNREEDDLSAPGPKRRRLNDDASSTTPPSGSDVVEQDALVYMCASPNSTCLATLDPSREVDMYHLAPFSENCVALDPLSMATHIANMFELSIVKGTQWWDIVAFMLAVHRDPKYFNLHRIVILKLMRDLHVLAPEQQRYYWRGIETIKSAIYRCTPGMEVNFANTQIRLQLTHATEVARGLLRGSIRA